MIGLLTLLGCAGERPSTLGVTDGELAACPDSPNCVSSFDTRESHGIEPITGSLEQVRQAVAAMKGAQIVSEGDGYLYAEFTSNLMGYVDDVEFLEVSSGGICHVRSASRLGYSDMGVNRKRVETIRAAVVALD